MSRPTSDSLLRPGENSWEFWKFPPKGDPVCEMAPSEKSLASAQNLTLALPVRDVVAVPLWIAAEADPRELAELELTSRHLLRRNAAVHALPLFSREGRSLILAIGTADEAISSPYFTKARRFEISARLWKTGGADALLWRELGQLCFAFCSGDRVIYFSATGETTTGPAFAGIISRAALRLKAEGVLDRLPASLRLLGTFSEEERESLAHTFHADIEHLAERPAPVLPSPVSNPAPPSATAAELQRISRRKFAGILMVGGLIYLALVGVLAGDLVWQSLQLSQLRNEAAKSAPAAEAAQKVVTEWQEFRPAIDPDVFALDLLAAVAAEIPGERVRLTQFTLDNGRLLVTGEAADVAQAYQFSERVQASPKLQDFDWTSRQPQLAGKSKVRFEMEGIRPDAKTDPE